MVGVRATAWCLSAYSVPARSQWRAFGAAFKSQAHWPSQQRGSPKATLAAMQRVITLRRQSPLASWSGERCRTKCTWIETHPAPIALVTWRTRQHAQWLVARKATACAADCRATRPFNAQGCVAARNRKRCDDSGCQAPDVQIFNSALAPRSWRQMPPAIRQGRPRFGIVPWSRKLACPKALEQACLEPSPF